MKRAATPQRSLRARAPAPTPSKRARAAVISGGAPAKSARGSPPRFRASDLRRFAEIVEASTDCVGIADPQGRALYLNRAGRRMVGLALDADVSRMKIPEFHPAWAARTVLEVGLPAAIRDGSWTGESALRTRDGREIPVSQLILAHRSPDGAIEFISTVIRDISLQKNAIVIQQSEERLRAILEHAPEAMVVLDVRSGKFVEANRATERLLQLDRGQIIGRGPTDFGAAVQPDGRSSMQVMTRGIERTLAGEVPVYEWMLRTGTGEEKLAEVRGVRLPDPERVLILAIVIDITERKRAEEAVRKSEERFQIVARATNDVVWDWDLATQRLWWNENFQTLFGYAAGEIEPGIESWESRLHPEDRERVLRDIHALIDGGGQYWSDEYRFRRKDGAYASIFDRGYVLHDQRGKPVRMIGAMMDLSERRRLEVQLLQAQRLEGIGRLAGGLAHDFNNLLTAIFGHGQHAQLLLADHEEARADIQQILHAAERAAGLTRQLLTFARRQMIQPRPLDLNEVTLQMDRMLRRLIGEQIEVVTSLATGLWLVKADPGQMEQVILNLVINARDAMPKQGRLTIQTANVSLDAGHSRLYADMQPGDYVMLAVSDTGIGMDETVMEHVFEPFFTTKDKERGTGLGLATCYGIVKLNGGSLSVESEPGRGSTFKVLLPRARSAVEPMPRGTLADAPPGSETVLLVEDEPLVRAMALMALQEKGYRVLEATHGEEALRVAGEAGGPIHLMVTDVVMPQMGGVELAQRLLQMHPGLRVLFTSGYTEDAIADLTAKHPELAFLEKPFSSDQLVQRVRRLLDSAPRAVS